MKISEEVRSELESISVSRLQWVLLFWDTDTMGLPKENASYQACFQSI